MYSRLPWCHYCRQAMLFVLTRFATFLLGVLITSYINTQLERFDSAEASWRSRSIRTDWNEMIRAANWWEEWLWAEGLQATWVRLLQRSLWLQLPDHLNYITMQISILGLTFSFLSICFISLFDGLMESHCCLCKCYNAYVSLESPFLLHFWPKTMFSFSRLTLLITSHFILWLLQTSSSIFIDVACYNHSRVFTRYSGCHEKIDEYPILPLNKNYSRNT